MIIEIVIAAQLICPQNSICWSYPTETEDGEQLYVLKDGEAVPMVEPDTFEIDQYMPGNLDTPINTVEVEGDERFLNIPDLSRCYTIRAVDETGPSEATGHENNNTHVCKEASCHVE